MSDQPEPLSAILADYRADIPAMTSGELPHPTPEYLRILLDRIESAVERELEIARDLGRIDRESDNMARAADALEKAFATGNAAAMQRALNSISDIAEDAFGGPERYREASQGRALSLIVDTARAALSKPARNCDRQECADVESAWATYCAETNMADCKGFARWLFAPAKGGEE